ncbi:MAG TPA: tetratricopeptide repeat protein, partial [Candidatus Obscuribacterales bacterium]
DCARALDRAPRCAETFDTLGLTQFLQGEYANANENFSKAIQLKPDNGAAYFHRSMLHRKMGAEALAARDAARSTRLGYKPELWELGATQSAQ